MFCTDKERQTCDVEKRGCEGCYYSNELNEAITLLSDLSFQYKTLRDLQYTERARAIDMVLSELKINRKTIADLKEKLIAENSKRNQETKHLQDELWKLSPSHLFDLNERIKEQEKVINMMAKDIMKVSNTCFHNLYNTCDKCNIAPFECCKEYYFKEASENDDRIL